MTMPPVALLAGGRATRLGGLARETPKALMPVAGEPFLAHQLRLFRRLGASRVVLLIGHLGEQIEAFAKDGAAFGLEISYARDGARQRGTGGALRAALPMLGDLFFVTYGDSYLDIDLEDLLRAKARTGLPAVMSVFRNRGQWDTSNVIFDGVRVLAHDKTLKGAPGVEWIDYGLSLFAAHVVSSFRDAEPFDLSTLTGRLAREGRLAGVEAKRRFYEIGRPESLAETELFISTH